MQPVSFHHRDQHKTPQCKLLSVPHPLAGGRAPRTGQCVVQLSPRRCAESCHHHVSNASHTLSLCTFTAALDVGTIITPIL